MKRRTIVRVRSIGVLALAGSLVLAGGCGPTDLTRLAQLRQKTLDTAKLDNAVAAGGSDVRGAVTGWTTLRQDYVTLVKELPDHSSELNQGLALVDKRLALLREETGYASRIDLRNLHRDTGTFGGFIPADGVFGEVGNTGQRTITLLQLRIDLIDNSGRAISNVTAKVVTLGENQPIPPGAARAFGVGVGHPGAVWTSARGSVTLLRLSRQGLRFPGEPDTSGS